jgi:hypothetical protein
MGPQVSRVPARAAGLRLGHARQDLTQRAEGVLMGVSVEVNDTGSLAAQRQFEALFESLTVGVHEDAGTYEDGTPVAVVAAVHEFGSDTTPQRSWLRGWLDSGGREEMADAFAVQLGRVIDGEDPGRAADEIGVLVVEGIKRRMDRGIAGEGGAPARDLQRTGRLISEITYEVAP